MKKYTVKIEGMMCGMCEAHISDTIRKIVPDAKKVTASRKKNEATFLSENEISDDVLEKAVADTGYKFISVSSEEFKKHGLFGR